MLFQHVFNTFQDHHICDPRCIHSPPYTEEAEVQRIFKENNLYYPVPVTVEDASPLQGFPWIKPSDFLKTMASYNDLSNILGGFSNLWEAEPMLVTFWERYRRVFPAFGLFEQVDRGVCTYKQCIPLYLHGDEGITYKKNGVLIISFQSPLGFGTSKRPQELSLNLRNMGEAGLPMNFLKAGMLTRMVNVICPKDLGFDRKFPSNMSLTGFVPKHGTLNSFQVQGLYIYRVQVFEK